MAAYRDFVASPIKLSIVCLIIASLYFFSAKLGLILAIVQKNATPVWPPSGIAIALMLIFGYRIWPGVFLGALIVNLSTNISFIAASSVATGNTLEAVCAVYLVWRFVGSSYPLSQANDFFKFIILACMLSTMVSATVGVTTLGLADELPWTSYWKVWGIWWAGDAVGVLVIGTLLLSLFYYRNSKRFNFAKGIELVVIILFASLVSIIIFSDITESRFTRLMIGLGLVPILIWSSFRLNIMATTMIIFLLSIISILGTAQGFGPFVQDSINESVILLQGFIAVTALTMLSLTIVVGEYNRTESLFRYAYNDTGTSEKQDTTEKFNLAEHPEFHQEVWRSLAENSPDYIMLLDPEGKIIFINHTVYDLSPNEVIGQSVYQYVQPEQAQTMRSCYERVLKTGKSDQFEITYIGSQEPIYFDNRVAAVKHEGQVIGLTVSSRDITARKKAELLKDRLMAIVEETSDFIAMADVNGQALYLNKAGRQMMGFPADLNITETAIPDYHTKEEAEKVLTEILPFVSQFGIWSGELKFLNREGHEFPTTTVLLAHKSPDGEVEFYSAIARDISDRINAEKKILESQTMLQLIMDTIPVRVFWKDTHGHYLGCNRLFARDAGLETQNELIGKDDYDLFPAQAELYRADDKQVMETGIPKLNYEEPQGTPEGKTIWLETSKTPLRDTLGQIVGMLGSYYDITDRKRVEDIISTLAKQSSSLSNDDEFFKECLRNLGEFYNTKFVFIGLLSNEKQTHVQSYLVWNEGEFGGSFEYALEGTPCEDVINSSSNLVSEGVASLYPKDQMLIDMGLDSYYGAALVLPSKEVFGLVVVTDTKPLTLEPWAKPILEIYATRIAIEMERKRIEDELHGMATTMSYQATHDPLTDLINRREFEQRLQTALKVSKLEGHEHVLCYLDLDQFKVVNDTCGHFAGDELLKLLAEQLHTAIRESDTLARLGGDEFGVLLQDCPIEKAVNIAENLLNVVKGFRFAWEDKLFEIGVSIGLVTIDRKTLSINQALSAADAACYLAKELGRNRIHIYQEDDTELAKRHGEMQIVSDITQALEEERFVLYSQSIIPLKHLDSSEKHFEVLIRMQDRENKLILPGNFIGAAERYNLMPSLDKWVIENTFKYMSTLKKGDSFGIDLCAINLSGTTLSDDKFIDYMHKLLDTYKLPPELICFEITETAAITNITKAMNFISRFKDIGFRFSLDDFGAGLSSYSYLKNLPVDFIKIDGSFVSGIANDPLNRSIVESITQVGHTMGIQIIAEWVDSEGVLKILTEIGVDYAQGFSIDKPAPLVKN